MKRLRKFKRKVRIGLADYSRFKTTRAAIRVNGKAHGNGNGRSKFLKSTHSEILTLNVRNEDFIDKYNRRFDLIHLTKQETKNRLLPANIPMPLTYLTVSCQDDLMGFYEFLAYNHRSDFVIKPNHGHVGKGILVIKKCVGKRFIAENNRALDLNQVTTHIQRIFKGRFSRGKRDSAIIEERIQPHKKLRTLFSNGLLDIRVICLQGYPVMAMIRLPTNRSQGKANIHRGAIGAGLQISSGEIFHAMLNRREITEHPDTKYKFIGFKIQNWNELLILAVRAQMISGLGFAGVDLCLDGRKGLMVMEVNKRPGLEIQIANQAGLLKRLRLIEKFSSNLNEDLSTSAKIEKAITWDRDGWAK